MTVWLTGSSGGSVIPVLKGTDYGGQDAQTISDRNER